MILAIISGRRRPPLAFNALAFDTLQMRTVALRVFYVQEKTLWNTLKVLLSLCYHVVQGLGVSPVASRSFASP